MEKAKDTFFSKYLKLGTVAKDPSGMKFWILLQVSFVLIVVTILNILL